MPELNADVLTRIFLNLHFVERVRLETVCQLWHCVLQRQACFSDTRELNIADFLSNNTSDYYQQESISLAPTVLGVVERCGRYVKSLSFGSRWLRVSQHIIDCIADNCDQLRDIDLGAVILNADVYRLLEKAADRLETLSLEETSWVSNENADKISSIFGHFKHLHTINLRSAMFSIENIVHLPPTLRKIDMSQTRRFPEQAMVQFLRGHPLLESISASRCPVISQEIIDAFADLQHLEQLDLGFVDDRTLNLAPLARLVGLRTLRFQNLACLNETSLSALLSALVNLTTLAIRRCDRVFDYSSLAFCERVTSLTISDTTQLSDDDLILMSTRCSLKYICFANCLNVTSEGLNYALAHCQLQQLLLSNCPGITDEVLYQIASTQENISIVSVQRCLSITSKGVAALGWLKNIRALRQLDVSKNRQIDDFAVFSLHNALKLARRPLPCLSASDTDCHRKKKALMFLRELQPNRDQTLTLFVSQTSISSQVEESVRDLIILAY